MTEERDLDYMLSVMQAAKEGKPIEVRERNAERWCEIDAEDCSWNWSAFDYRVAPEPVEVAWEEFKGVNEYLRSGERCFRAGWDAAIKYTQQEKA